VSADLSDVVLLLGGSVVVLAGLPLLYTWRQTSVTLLLLYVHTAAVLTLGGFLGAVFVVPLYDDVALLGGQLAYAGFMYAALVTVIVGRDVRVLRNVIVLTIAVNLVKYTMFRLTHLALETEGIGNPFGVASEVFDQSVRVVVVGGALNLLELILLLSLLELAKTRVAARSMRFVYVLAFVGILVLDGVLFPTLVLLPDEGLLDVISAGVQGKALLALAFAIPLGLFVLLHRHHVDRYEATELRLSYLVTSPQNSLFMLLERQEEQIAEQLERLQGADRLRNDMVRYVSHELSTPITSINGYLEMLSLGDDLTRSQRDAVERALRNTARLRRLVEDLRLISQVDTGGLAVDQDLDLREVVESCREQVEESVRTRDLDLQWDTSEQSVRVRGDRTTLREVVLRLAGNAVKFTPDGGHVAVTVQRARDSGLLTVSDTGIGIPPEDQERIFGRFERGSEVDDRAIQGAGLGLSIVSAVVHRHDGHVDVQSAPGEGTTIRVTLPAADPAANSRPGGPRSR
jgi:signal transduction histidine kinase